MVFNWFNGCWVDGGFCFTPKESNRSTGALNIHYTRGQSINHLSQPTPNQWTFYISDDPRYVEGIRIGCSNTSTLSALENSVGMIYFAIGGKDFNIANYSDGGDYSGSRPRTVIARLNQ